MTVALRVLLVILTAILGTLPAAAHAVERDPEAAREAACTSTYAYDRAVNVRSSRGLTAAPDDHLSGIECGRLPAGSVATCRAPRACARDSHRFGATRGTSAFGARTLGAAEVRVLQSGGNRITAATARALNEQAGLNVSRREWGRALKALKKDFDLPNNHHGRILGTGDYSDEAGKAIGSIFDFVKGGL